MSIGEKNENFDNYINNFEYCYACKNQIIFNESDIQKFLERYLYKKVNKKMIFMIYRLFPKIIHYINFDYFKKYKSYIFEITKLKDYTKGKHTWYSNSKFRNELANLTVEK